MQQDNDVIAPKAESPVGIGHNSNREKKSSGEVRSVAPESVAIWLPAAEQGADATPDVLEAETEILAASGQRAPVPAREREDGTIEVVAKVHIVDAVRLFNGRYPDQQIALEVRVFRAFSDDVAYRLLAQEAEPGHEPSSLARGQLFLRAVQQFGSVEEAAAGCRVSKAAVSKNLDVARCLKIVGEKIIDPRNISQRDATWLMGLTGRQAQGRDASDREIRGKLLVAIEKQERGTAKRVFAALRAAVETPSTRTPRNRIPLVINDRPIGYLRLVKHRLADIRFDDIGDVVPADIADAIRIAIEQHRDTLNR